MSGARGSWRLVGPGDLPFVYHLVAQVDPRWWRFSKHGLEPQRALQTAQSLSAGVLVSDAAGAPVAVAVLAEAGGSGTGMFEYFALPNDSAEAVARAVCPEIVTAAFAGADRRLLYHERFTGDADLLGATSPFWREEVRYPEFARIDGRYEDRVTLVMTADAHQAMTEATTETTTEGVAS